MRSNFCDLYGIHAGKEQIVVQGSGVGETHTQIGIGDGIECTVVQQAEHGLIHGRWKAPCARVCVCRRRAIRCKHSIRCPAFPACAIHVALVCRIAAVSTQNFCTLRTCKTRLCVAEFSRISRSNGLRKAGAAGDCEAQDGPRRLRELCAQIRAVTKRIVQIRTHLMCLRVQLSILRRKCIVASKRSCNLKRLLQGQARAPRRSRVCAENGCCQCINNSSIWTRDNISKSLITIVKDVDTRERREIGIRAQQTRIQRWHGVRHGKCGIRKHLAKVATIRWKRFSWKVRLRASCGLHKAICRIIHTNARCKRVENVGARRHLCRRQSIRKTEGTLVPSCTRACWRG